MFTRCIKLSLTRLLTTLNQIHLTPTHQLLRKLQLHSTRHLNQLTRDKPILIRLQTLQIHYHNTLRLSKRRHANNPSHFPCAGVDEARAVLWLVAGEVDVGGVVEEEGVAAGEGERAEGVGRCREHVAHLEG